jgi:hypothetical protein
MMEITLENEMHRYMSKFLSFSVKKYFFFYISMYIYIYIKRFFVQFALADTEQRATLLKSKNATTALLAFFFPSSGVLVSRGKRRFGNSGEEG